MKLSTVLLGLVLIGMTLFAAISVKNITARYFGMCNTAWAELEK